jgi:ABC-2 type transport system permease protein
LLVALSMIGLGEGVAGAFAFGLSYAAAGLVFASVAAVAAQVSEGARTANGISVTVLAVAYVVRGAGNAMSADGSGWLSWLSPLGWTGVVRPYSGERWWVLLFPAALCIVLVRVAYALVGRRDLGAGLVQPRLGPAHGGLGGPFALAWRLQRGMLLAWTVGFALLGVVVGTVARGVGDIVGDNEQMADIVARIGGKGGIVDAYFAALMGIFGLIAAAYTTQSALRLRGEEAVQRAEPVLATRVGRLVFAASHLVYPFVGTVVLLAVMGLAAGLVHGVNTHDVGGQVPRIVAAALVMAPACWVVAGLATAGFGLLPHFAAGVSWAVVGVCLAITEVGPLVRLNHWVMDVSPFSHVPKLPGGTVSAAPLVWLVAIAAVATVAGLAGFRRRDVG